MNAKKIDNNAIAKAKADWVKSMTESFYAIEKKEPHNIGAIGVGNTIIVIIAVDVDEPLIGVAKCNPADSYDREVAIAIAYARAIVDEIPDYVLGTCKDEDEDDVIGNMIDKYIAGSNWAEWDGDEDDEPDWDDDVTFGELVIGERFIDSDAHYIKVDNNKAYSYQSKKVLEYEDNYPIEEVETE